MKLKTRRKENIEEAKKIIATLEKIFESPTKYTYDDYKENFSKLGMIHDNFQYMVFTPKFDMVVKDALEKYRRHYAYNLCCGVDSIVDYFWIQDLRKAQNYLKATEKDDVVTEYLINRINSHKESLHKDMIDYKLQEFNSVLKPSEESKSEFYSKIEYYKKRMDETIKNLEEYKGKGYSYL